MTGKKTKRRTPGTSAFACGLPTPQFEGIPDIMRLGMPLEGDWLELCGHRLSAWLEWPEHLCNCKSMDELTTAQSEYLATMHKHYADYMDAVLRDTLIAPGTFEEESEDDTSGQSIPEPERKAA